MAIRSYFPASIKIDGADGGSAVAGGAGDATKITGPWIDRMADGAEGYDYMSTVIAGTTTLTQAKTLAVTVTVEQAPDDGSGAADTSNITTLATEATAAVVATGATGGSTEYVSARYDRDLRPAQRWVRINVTPDLSNTATDTAAIGFCAVLGAPTSKPAV